MGGIFNKPSAPAQAPVAEPKAIEPVKVTQSQEEQGARMRGSKRRGRQLLSDARLSSEAGVETLGGGQSLG